MSSFKNGSVIKCLDIGSAGLQEAGRPKRLKGGGLCGRRLAALTPRIAVSRRAARSPTVGRAPGQATQRPDRTRRSVERRRQAPSVT